MQSAGSSQVPKNQVFPLIFFAHCPLRCAYNGKSFRGLSDFGLMPPEVRAIIPACDAVGSRYPAAGDRGVVDPMLNIYKKRMKTSKPS